MTSKQSTSHITRYVSYPKGISSVALSDGLRRRFEAKVAKRGDHECWLWAGYRLPRGYGMLSGGGRGAQPVYAHRIAYLLAHGELPAAAHVLHRCDTPACVNPAHLFLGDHAANMADAARKGRLHVQRPRRQKVTDAQVAEIVALSRAGVKGVLIADRFGVSKTFVSLVANGKRRAFLGRTA